MDKIRKQVEVDFSHPSLYDAVKMVPLMDQLILAMNARNSEPPQPDNFPYLENPRLVYDVLIHAGFVPSGNVDILPRKVKQD